MFGRIGLLSFGGPAAQIALIHRELVEERRWLDEPAFLRALSFCMFLPGPEATQLAAYAGWRRAGIGGALIGGGLFILPGAAVVLALAALYIEYRSLPLVDAAFWGLRAAVVAIVAEALLRLSRRALTGGRERIIAGAALAALMVAGIPFWLVVIMAAVAGVVFLPPAPATDEVPAAQGHARRSLGILMIGAAIWILPVGLVALSGSEFLTTLGLYFSRLALVTFGGAYTVLAAMVQTIANSLGWITTAQMIDALALAETTPGPLILVTEFAAYLAGHAQGGPAMALTAAALTLWVTFVPSLVWIIAFAPHIERLASLPRLSAALAGISAAAVGVIASLGLWFAAQVIFTRPNGLRLGPFALPDLASVDLPAVALVVIAAILLLRLHWPLALVLALSALTGILYFVMSGTVP
ncbi:chromate efflux transporter [Paracoccus pacificus]|uniref:Chromate efflux transporter n=1 Tax=Paracoccus pacificus TaxID=1463598 RepID=A0ABW4RA42_9RHOB